LYLIEIDSLIYLESVERFKYRSRPNVMKFRSFGDSTSSRVMDKLKTKAVPTLRA